MRSKSVVLAVVIGLIAIASVVVVAQRREAGAQTKGLTGVTMKGEQFDLASLRGRPVVLNFFASWCPPCNAEAPDLVAFSAAHPEVTFVGVAISDTQGKVQAFLDKYGMTYTVVYDESGRQGDAWGVTGIPTTFFLDAAGVQKDMIVGAASTAMLEASLQKAL